MANKSTRNKRWICWSLILALGLSVAACSSPEERAQAHYQSGKELLQSGEFIKAGLEFRNALKYNEKLADAWYGLAAVEEKNANWPLVADSLRRVVELDNKNIKALIKLAKLQLASNQLDEALKNVNAANGLKKDDTDILALRAAVLFRLNDKEGAKADAERALALNSDNPDAHAVLAAEQIAAGNLTAALRFVDRGLAGNPNNLGLLMFKLKIFEDNKDDKNLEAVLRQIIAANPESKEMRQALLAFLASRNRLADVEAEMRAMLAADPDNAGKALDLVRLVGRIKGAQAARTELEALIAAKPTEVEYRFALAQMDYAARNTAAATAAIEAIIAKGEPKEDVQRAQLLLANMKLQLGEVDAAKALIASVLGGDEKNADALALRATISLEAGDLDNAVGDLREALSQRPRAIPLMQLLSRALERQGAVDLANDRLAEALRASDYTPQIALDYVAFLTRRGRGDEIEATLSEALTRNPRDPRLLSAMARVKLNKQDWVGAQALADALKQSGDTSSVSQEIIGALLLGQKKYEESIATLKDAYAATPNNARPMYSLFVAYVQSGKLAEAETFIQSVLTANRANADALAMLGALRELQKKPAEAEALYKSAIEGQPKNPAGYSSLAKFYFLQKRPAEAEDVLRRGRQAIAGELGLSLALASLLETTNDMEGAIAIYEEQLKATPDAPVVINNLASLLADYRSDAASLDRASQLSRRLAAIDVPQFKDTLGWVAYRTGDYRTALLNLEAAAEKLPGLALVKYHLAMTYAALKRTADARAEFAKAEALIAGDDPLRQKITEAVAALPAANSGG
jgi:tetratricopeptide (TPR) repeat protein